jgi:hypothetical protein
VSVIYFLIGAIIRNGETTNMKESMLLASF